MKFFFLLALSLSFFARAEVTCFSLFSSQQNASFVLTQELQARYSKLRVGSYNSLNLFLNVGKYTKDKFGNLTQVPGQDQRVKADWEVDGVHRAVKDINADFLVMQEVEGEASLRAFVDRYSDLKAVYEPFIIQGNDARGIQIGMLVKKDLQLEFEYVSNKDEMWTDPITGTLEKIFSRDFPVLKIWPKGFKARGPPMIAIFGVHMKSQRDRDEDTSSAILREAQAVREEEMLKKFQLQNPQTAVMAMGDFNGDLATNKALEPIRQNPIFHDVFDFFNMEPQDRITHCYFPNGAPASYSQLDGILVNDSLKPYVTNAKVYRYMDNQGNVKPLPQSFRERQQNPSDHFPIYAEINFLQLLNQYLNNLQ